MTIFKLQNSPFSGDPVTLAEQIDQNYEVFSHIEEYFQSQFDLLEDSDKPKSFDKRELKFLDDTYAHLFLLITDRRNKLVDLHGYVELMTAFAENISDIAADMWKEYLVYEDINYYERWHGIGRLLNVSINYYGAEKRFDGEFYAKWSDDNKRCMCAVLKIVLDRDMQGYAKFNEAPAVSTMTSLLNFFQTEKPVSNSWKEINNYSKNLQDSNGTPLLVTLQTTTTAKYILRRLNNGIAKERPWEKDGLDNVIEAMVNNGLLEYHSTKDEKYYNLGLYAPKFVLLLIEQGFMQTKRNKDIISFSSAKQELSRVSDTGNSAKANKEMAALLKQKQKAADSKPMRV